MRRRIASLVAASAAPWKACIAIFSIISVLIYVIPAFAQAPNQPSSSTSPNTAAESSDQPTIILALQRPDRVPPKKDDPYIALQEYIRDILRTSGHFQVVVYNAGQPRVQRALLERSITVTDLKEPLQPLGLQHLGTAIGARAVLLLAPTFDKITLRTDVRMIVTENEQEWHVLFTGPLTVSAIMGKKRLKPTEVVALAADGIASSLGMTSDLATKLHIKNSTRVVKDTKSKSHPNPGSTSPDDAATADGGAAVPTDSGDAAPGARSADIPNTSGITPDAVTSPTGGSTDNPNGASLGQPAGGASSTATALNNLANLLPIGKVARKILAQSRKDAAQSTQRLGDGVTGDIGVPVPATPIHEDPELMAAHYHDVGDLTNAIVELRHAVDDKPLDVAVRMKLIQAYQDDQMPDAALGEIDRTLLFAPAESGLYRLHGDALFAKGDISGAAAAYKDASRLDPNDIRAQVALGDALRADNQFIEAASAYSAAAAADPKSPLPHRRLAISELSRAGSDPSHYSACLDQVKQARSLTAPGDKSPYLDDYAMMMKVVEARIREMLDEVEAGYRGRITGQTTPNAALRSAADVKVRGDAVADFLDKLPPAVGLDATHVHYQQATALLQQAISLFREFVSKGDDGTVAQAMKDGLLESRRELETAHARLTDVHAALKQPIKPTSIDAQGSAPSSR